MQKMITGIIKIHEFLKWAKVWSKAMPLDDLSGAVSAFHQSSSEPVVLDNVEITNPKTYSYM